MEKRIGHPANASARYRVRPDVRRTIERENLSQNKLAEKCGITSGFMSQLLSGQRCAGPETRERLLKAIRNASFDMLFEEVKP